MISRQELIKKYTDFFKSKNHKEIPNVSLVPENDPTVLFTTAGMHPLVPYLLGAKHPLGKNLVNVQRCIRTGDIDEVGDEFHHTFFEMLGNWSLGDYWKKGAIEYSIEFLTKILKIPKEKIGITVFGGDKRVPQVPKDNEAAKIWEDVGINKDRIAFVKGGVLESDNNWWGPAGKTGPCGPDTEMFYWKSKSKSPAKFNPEDSKWVEIWNDVLMQYIKDEKGNYKTAKQQNVDTGMGVERTTTILNGLEDDYLSECFLPIIKQIEKLSKKKYNKNKEETKTIRIIADHIKAAVFILADGITPSNTEQGYVLRRLIRRTIIHARKLNLENFTTKVALPVFNIYNDYQILKKNKSQILEELEKEESRFSKTIEQGMKICQRVIKGQKTILGRDAFLLCQSYGFPLELTKELAKEKGIKVDEQGFKKEEEKHKELSRTATQGKFKSGLADNSKQVTKLHTATHLLNQALREVLKKSDIFQRGSNITPERLRFDFNFDRKLTDEEIKKVEDLVNKKIQENLEIQVKEMTPQEAKKIGAQGVFESKYGEKVRVYEIGKFSREICAGPHVKSTRELGKFKIIKEESIAAGIRRIKAILE